MPPHPYATFAVSRLKSNFIFWKIQTKKIFFLKIVVNPWLFRKIVLSLQTISNNNYLKYYNYDF